MSEKQSPPTEKENATVEQASAANSTQTSQASRESRGARSQTSTVIAPPVPPPLNYSIDTPARRRKIAIVFSLLFIESGVLPLILFYAIRWGAHLSNTTNLAIITCLLGTYSGYRLSLRLYYLWWSDGHHQRRPIGVGRWGVDAFMYLAGIASTAYFIPLIIGSSLNPGSVETTAMALPCLILFFCLPLLITGLWPHRIKMPVHLSSLPAYTPLPPLTYTLVEDLVAVDGDGCVEFRLAWCIRYEHSPVMRRIVRLTALAWGATGTLVGAALIVVAWTTASDIGYGCGFGLSWLWGIVMAFATLWWVRRELAREHREWSAVDHENDVFSLHINRASETEKQAHMLYNQDQLA